MEEMIVGLGFVIMVIAAITITVFFILRTVNGMKYNKRIYNCFKNRNR